MKEQDSRDDEIIDAFDPNEIAAIHSRIVDLAMASADACNNAWHAEV